MCSAVVPAMKLCSCSVGGGTPQHYSEMRASMAGHPACTCSRMLLLTHRLTALLCIEGARLQRAEMPCSRTHGQVMQSWAKCGQDSCE